MYDTITESICVEDLFKLEKEIREYIESVCAAEQAEYENNPDLEYIKGRVVERGLAFKRRIKHFYIDLGIAKDIEQDVASLPVVEVILNDELAA